jgi:hypothetical protein
MGQLNWPLNEGKLLSDFKSRKKSVGCKKKLFPIRMHAGPLVSGENIGELTPAIGQNVRKLKCTKQLSPKTKSPIQ